MNGVHDMGGMHGMGSIQTENDEPAFHERREGRAFALTLAMAAWRKMDSRWLATPARADSLRRISADEPLAFVILMKEFDSPMNAGFTFVADDATK